MFVHSLSRLLLMVSIAALGVVGSSAARAISVTPDPLTFDLSPTFSFAGSIDFVAAAAGVPSGGSVLAGAVSPTDLSLLFTITMDPGSDAITNLSLINFTDAAVGIGSVAGPGVDIASGTLNFPDVAFVGAGVAAGQTSDPIFVSYGSVTDGAEISFELFGALVALGQVTVVPEPSMALLLGTAMLAVGLMYSRLRA